MLEPYFLQEVRESLKKEEEEYLEKSKKSLEKAIANCFSNDLPQNLIDDSFRFMQSVTTELNGGITVDVEDQFNSYGNDAVYSLFQFVDRLQDSNPKNKSIIAFKKSLRVSPFHSLHSRQTSISVFTTRNSSCKVQGSRLSCATIPCSFGMARTMAAPSCFTVISTTRNTVIR